MRQVTFQILVLVLWSLNIDCFFVFGLVLCVFLFYVGFVGPCLVLGKERRSESMNTFGPQSFIHSLPDGSL